MSATPRRSPRRERGLAHHLLKQHLPLVVALTLVTLTGTATTYQALRIQGEANGADAQSVADTLRVANREINAEIAARAYEGMAGHYVTMLSAAGAIAKTDPIQAELERRIARDFAMRGGILGYLSAESPTAIFNYEAEYEAVLRGGDATGVPTEQPARTAARADRDHDRVRVLGLTVVGLLGVIVLITLARISRTHLHRILFGGLAGTSYAALVVVAALQVW